MAKTNFKSISEYIESKPRDVQPVLQRVRRTIRKAVPGLEESISYQIAAFKLNGVALLYFAGWKEHFSLYPVGDALAVEFQKELSGYKRSKGTVRFPFSEPVPVDLIERIAKFRAKLFRQREKGSGERKSGHAAQLARVRRICAKMPSVFEKPSHGAPTFFVRKDKGVFTVFSSNHHDDGRLAVWVPAPQGLQHALIEDDPETYFKPPYVGSSGWIGIELNRVRDEALEIHIRQAWEIAAGARKKARKSI